jgi:hypothetical protein
MPATATLFCRSVDLLELLGVGAVLALLVQVAGSVGQLLQLRARLGRDAPVLVEGRHRLLHVARAAQLVGGAHALGHLLGPVLHHLLLTLQLLGALGVGGLGCLGRLGGSLLRGGSGLLGGLRLGEGLGLLVELGDVPVQLTLGVLGGLAQQGERAALAERGDAGADALDLQLDVLGVLEQRPEVGRLQGAAQVDVERQVLPGDVVLPALGEVLRGETTQLVAAQVRADVVAEPGHRLRDRALEPLGEVLAGGRGGAADLRAQPLGVGVHTEVDVTDLRPGHGSPHPTDAGGPLGHGHRVLRLTARVDVLRRGRAGRARLRVARHRAGQLGVELASITRAFEEPGVDEVAELVEAERERVDARRRALAPDRCPFVVRDGEESGDDCVGRAAASCAAHVMIFTRSSTSNGSSRSNIRARRRRAES